MNFVAPTLFVLLLGTTRLASIEATPVVAPMAANSSRSTPNAPRDSGAPSPSLIPNGSFDGDTTGWRSFVGPSTSGQSDWARGAGRKDGGALHVVAAPSDARTSIGWSCTFDSLSIGRRLRVSAWVKGARCEVAPVATLSIVGADGTLSAATSGGTFTTSGDFDWTRIEVVVPVLDGGRSAFLSLFLRGAGEAWFDDVEAIATDSLTVTERRAAPLTKGPGLLRVHNAWEYSARVATLDSAAAGPEVLIALPLDYREQVPLTFELTTRPAGRVRAASVYEDRPGAWIARVQLSPLRNREKVVLDWSSVVLVGARSFRDFPRRVPLPREWPADARPWLASTPCAQADDPRIRAVAATIRDTTRDVRSIIENTLTWMSGLETEGREMCSVFDAVQALDHQGSCVSRANLAAALLRANGVPARMLGGYPSWSSGPLQCHFIVEAYVPAYGWFPVEPTQSRAPVRPSDQIQVSIVPPENEGERAVQRAWGARGLPYLSISEFLGDRSAFTAFGALDRDGSGAATVVQLQRYARDADGWDRAFEAARARWGAWLAEKPTLDALGFLRTPLASEALLEVRSPADLARRLAAP